MPRERLVARLIFKKAPDRGPFLFWDILVVMSRPPIDGFAGDKVYSWICTVVSVAMTLLVFVVGAAMLEQYRVSSTEANQVALFLALCFVPICLVRIITLRFVFAGRKAGFDFELLSICLQLLFFIFVLVSRVLPLLLCFPVLFARLLYIVRRRSGALGPALW